MTLLCIFTSATKLLFFPETAKENIKKQGKPHTNIYSNPIVTASSPSFNPTATPL